MTRPETYEHMIARNPPVPVITGPTGIGKTAISLKIAQGLDGEIVSVDSRQIYKELSIGAAKPTHHELNLVPHHFINELNLGQPYSAGLFARQAAKRIDEIFARNKIPIVVGGATLYLHALVYGLSPSIPSDSGVRTHIEKRLAQLGKNALYQELSQIDPLSARTMDPSKTARLVRALEVFELTGTPLSEFHATHTHTEHDFQMILLTMDRSTLYQRIEQRVDAMLENGLMDEIHRIRALQIDESLHALKSIGYREPFAYLDGRYDWDEMVKLIKRNSRRYAKRQLTWLRRYKPYRRICAQTSPDDLIKSITPEYNKFRKETP